MFARATADLLLGAALPQLARLFPPVPPAQLLQHTPTLIVAVLMGCLAAAFLGLSSGFGEPRRIFETSATSESFSQLQPPVSYSITSEVRPSTGL
jgi:hypothetical protein